MNAARKEAQRAETTEGVFTIPIPVIPLMREYIAFAAADEDLIDTGVLTDALEIQRQLDDLARTHRVEQSTQALGMMGRWTGPVLAAWRYSGVLLQAARWSDHGSRFVVLHFVVMFANRMHGEFPQLAHLLSMGLDPANDRPMDVLLDHTEED